jgi:hypothetical protein
LDRVNAWVHGVEPFYGLTVRASEWDNHGWKRFWSSNNGNPNLNPRLEVTYVPIPPGVSSVYPAQNAVVDTLTPTLFAAMVDPIGSPQRWATFTVCNGERDALTCYGSTGWIEGTSYRVPVGALAGWGKQSCWYVDVSNDVANMGTRVRCVSPRRCRSRR